MTRAAPAFARVGLAWICVHLCSSVVAVPPDAAARTDALARRIFDFTPVSAENPVVARIDGTIEIPLSELRGYREAERLRAISDPADLAQKRAVLDDLINEYLFVDEAYRAGVPEMPAFVRRMDATRTMVLTDFLAARANESAAAPAPSTDDPAHALADRLFEAADISVSNEAYALLKSAAAAVDRVGAGPLPPTDPAPLLHAILRQTPEATLVRYEQRQISVRQILAIYAGLPAEKRPRVATEPGLIEMIKPLIAPELMALEAQKRGIAATPEFQNKIIQNRNALLRFHAHGAIESRANETLRAPDLEARLRAWFPRHAARYAPPGGRAPEFAVVRDQVLGDFSVDLRERLLAEKAAELRQLRRVTIDEAMLRQL